MECLIDCDKEKGELNQDGEGVGRIYEGYYAVQNRDKRMGAPDITELQDELGDMELKNFLYKR